MNLFELRDALQTADILGDDEEARRIEILIDEQIEAERVLMEAEFG